MLQDTHLYALWMLMETAWHFLDGPDNNRYRYRQITDCCEYIQNRSGPHTNASFQRYGGAMRDELVESGHDFLVEEDVDIEVWQAWSERSKTRPIQR